MAHPTMYDDGDLHFQRVRTLALALPEAQLKVSHGRPAFFTTKVFAYYGTSVKATAAGGGTPLPSGGVRSGDWDGYLQYPRALVIKPEASDLDYLDQDPRAFRPAYLGASGWFAIDLSALDPAAEEGEAGEAGEEGWAEVAEWLEASYRLTAPARCVRALDA